MSHETEPGGPSPLEEYRTFIKQLESVPLTQKKVLLAGISDAQREVLMAGKDQHHRQQTQDAFATLINLPGGHDEPDWKAPEYNPQAHSGGAHSVETSGK